MYVHNLSSALSDLGLCPSSAFDRLEFETDADRIDLTLMCGQDEFYRATLFAFGGRVSADRMSQVVDAYMLAKGIHRATVTVRAMPPATPSAMALMDVDVAYCSYTLPEGHDLSAAFLTLMQSQRVPPSAVLDVYGPMSYGQSVSVRVSGVDADGNPDSFGLEDIAMDGWIRLSFPEILAAAKSDHGIARLTAVSLFAGDAVKSFFVVDMPSFVEFRFRNCFNCRESVYVSGISQMVTDVSTDMAVCNGRAMQYNRTVTRSYEHSTAPLTRLEAAALSQLVESPATEICVDGEYYPVIVTDHDLKVSNDDSTLNSAKFTWRFSDSRPRLFGDGLSPLLESYGIFTHQFEEPFQ